MLPARKPINSQSFFGKSYPRAIGHLGDENKLVKLDGGPQLPNAPFLKWAGHTAWERGGTAAHWKGRPPKEPSTALQAFQLYLRSHQPADKPAEAVTEAEKMHAAEDHKQEQAEGALHERWQALSPAERAIFEDLAREDARRYLEEATHFETLNPGWFQRRHERPPPKQAPAAARKPPRAGGTRAAAAGPNKKRQPPAPVMTPWDAFLKEIAMKMRMRDPKTTAQMTQEELLALSTRQSKPFWAEMTEGAKAEYVKIAAEDQARFERETAAYEAESAARRERRAAAKAARALKGLSASGGKRQRSGRAAVQEAAAGGAHAEKQRGRKPRKAAARKLDPEAAAKEAMEKVDVTGMTGMQAWAAKQRAAKKAAAAAAPRCTTRSKAAAVAAAAAAGEPDGAAMAGLSISEARPPPTSAAADGARFGGEPDLAQELPDEAYIRSRRSGAEGDASDDSSEEDDDVEISGSDEESGGRSDDDMGMEGDLAGDVPEEATPLEEAGPSQVSDSQPSATQAGEAGVLGRMRSALIGGFGWLTAGRKRRGLLAGMQGAPAEGAVLAERRAAKAPAAVGVRRATPRRLEPSLGAAAAAAGSGSGGFASSLDEGPASAAKRRRQSQ